MATIYEILRAKKGAAYSEDKIKKWSFLRTKPNIDKPAGALAGNSRIHGDATPVVQDHVIDLLVEIGARFKLAYRDIAHLLLICKIESGFNPDAAAGTTSAAGLGQYTVATVEEAAKPTISKSRLGFILDLSGDYVMDAERGAYGVVLSYMIAKEKAVKHFGNDYEKKLYLFHHEGWYFQPTAENMAKARTLKVIEIIKTKIIPDLSTIEQLLSKKTEVSFKLITKDDKPYADQPYVAIYPSGAAASKVPKSVQADTKKKAALLFGKTDAQGKTSPVATPGLSEVIFVILNRDYKDFLDINKSQVEDVHTVKKNETLAKIAKDSGVSVDELKKINNISDPNKIQVGQKINLHMGDYLWRRPPLDLIASYLKDALNMHMAAAPAVVEHKRSHIVLPSGNAAQKHAGDTNVVAIRGGANSAKVAQRKKKVDIPHQTVEKDIKKQVVVAPVADGKVLQDGLLFPLPSKSQQSYHTGARKFNSSRGKRRHAGCDLYAPVGTEVRAMADGKVVNCYSFYWKTDAIEVDHGTFIARYGEVASMSKSERDALIGKQVKRGDVLAKVGQLIQPSGNKYKDTMLHLEMYGSTQSPLKAPLTNKSSPFMRRADLVDPTPTIDKCVLK
jgi:murein DD-endopeptidase MepM/ murein hydrolase activator NlpD